MRVARVDVYNPDGRIETGILEPRHEADETFAIFGQYIVRDERGVLVSEERSPDWTAAEVVLRSARYRTPAGVVEVRMVDDGIW